MTKQLAMIAVVLLAVSGTVSAQYQGWGHCGSLYILTTPQGAGLPETALEKNFPLLVRLNSEWFDFSQAKANGEDIRFATGAGAALAYQIEQWDAAGGKASIWVRIPEVKGAAGHGAYYAYVKRLTRGV